MSDDFDWYSRSGAQADEVVVKEITPSKVESRWLEIDWKTDLWEARKEAARTGKPIYLWEMDDC